MHRIEHKHGPQDDKVHTWTHTFSLSVSFSLFLVLLACLLKIRVARRW